MVDVPSFVKSGRPPDAVVVADRLANPLPRNDLIEGAVRQLVELRRLSPDWIFSDDGTCESRNLHGALLEEAVWLLFEHVPSPYDAPWHMSGVVGGRSVIKHPESRAIQKQVVKAYAQCVLNEGLSLTAAADRGCNGRNKWSQVQSLQLLSTVEARHTT
jgi:hypothetical protein